MKYNVVNDLGVRSFKIKCVLYSLNWIGLQINVVLEKKGAISTNSRPWLYKNNYVYKIFLNFWGMAYYNQKQCRFDLRDFFLNKVASNVEKTGKK